MSKKTSAKSAVAEEVEQAEDPIVDAAEVADKEEVQDTTDYKSEAAKLREENESLRAANAKKAEERTSGVSNPVVTSDSLRNMGKEQREYIEEQTGKPFGEVLAQVENAEMRKSNAHIQAKLNVTEALEEAAEKDPQVHKLKVFMREYLGDVSVEDRADPEKLARHVTKAKVYAKGRLAEKGGYRTPAATETKVKSKGPDDSIEVEDGDDEEIKAGQEVNVDGLRFKVSQLGGKAAKRGADLKHPKDPNGIMFRGAGDKAFDRPPVFRRGED